MSHSAFSDISLSSFFLDLYSLPRQPSYPVFDQISISAVSIRLCLSHARLQPHGTFSRWVDNLVLSLRKLCRLFSMTFRILYPFCGTTDYASRNASDIAAYSYVFALWFLFTTWHLWSE
jgi:hypothetical protein